jgi:hypothetical protein
MREAQALRRRIAPGGEVFRSGHINVLRNCVQDVEDLARQAKAQLPFRDIEALDNHIEIAVKGIVRTHSVPAPASCEEKPELNTEDVWESM